MIARPDRGEVGIACHLTRDKHDTGSLSPAGQVNPQAIPPVLAAVFVPKYGATTDPSEAYRVIGFTAKEPPFDDHVRPPFTFLPVDDSPSCLPGNPPENGQITIALLREEDGFRFDPVCSYTFSKGFKHESLFDGTDNLLSRTEANQFHKESIEVTET